MANNPFRCMANNPFWWFPLRSTSRAEAWERAATQTHFCSSRLSAACQGLASVPNSMMHLNIVRQLFGFQYLLSFYEPLVPPAETLHTSDLPYLRQQSHRVLQKSFSGGACVSLIFLLFLLVRSVLWSWQKKDAKEKFTSICHERLASILPYTIPFLSYMP